MYDNNICEQTCSNSRHFNLYVLEHCLTFSLFFKIENKFVVSDNNSDASFYTKPKLIKLIKTYSKLHMSIYYTLKNITISCDHKKNHWGHFSDIDNYFVCYSVVRYTPFGPHKMFSNLTYFINRS